MACRRQGKLAEAEALCHRYLAGFEARGDAFGIGYARTSLGNVKAAQGHLVDAMRVASEARAEFEAIGATASALTAWANHAQFRLGTGDAQQQLADVRELLEAQRRMGRVGGTMHTLLVLGNTHQCVDALEEAAAIYRKGAALARRLNRPDDLVVCLSNEGDTYLSRRKWDPAIRLFREASEVVSTRGTDQWKLLVAGNLGSALARRGGADAAEGEALLRQTIEAAEQAGYRLYHAHFLSDLAQALSETGRDAKAEAPARRAVDLMEALPRPVARAMARLTLARVACGLGDVAEARRQLQRADAEAAGRRQPELVARSGEVRFLLAAGTA